MRPGDLLEQRYRLVRVLGRGRSGSVWCARNELIDRAVAVKVLHRSLASDPERLQRFFQEARACGRVRHPAVVEVLDLGQGEDGVLFLVMELLEGETMASLLGRRGRLSVDEALALVVPLAHGLAAAHAHGILHRDLKPANIYLHKTPTGGLQPKILDFGISKIVGTDVTATGVVLGTPSYMSPEQARGVSDLEARTDVWSLGVILYEALTGRLPFIAKEYRALVDEIIEKRHVPVRQVAPEVPVEVAKVVDDALEKSRDRRLPSAATMAQRLSELLRTRGRGALVRKQEDDWSEGAPTLAQDRDALLRAPDSVDDTVGDAEPLMAVRVPEPGRAASSPAVLDEDRDDDGARIDPSPSTRALAALASGGKRLENALPRPAAGAPARASQGAGTLEDHALPAPAKLPAMRVDDQWDTTVADVSAQEINEKGPLPKTAAAPAQPSAAPAKTQPSDAPAKAQPGAAPAKAVALQKSDATTTGLESPHARRSIPPASMAPPQAPPRTQLATTQPLRNPTASAPPPSAPPASTALRSTPPPPHVAPPAQPLARATPEAAAPSSKGTPPAPPKSLPPAASSATLRPSAEEPAAYASAQPALTQRPTRPPPAKSSPPRTALTVRPSVPPTAESLIAPELYDLGEQRVEQAFELLAPAAPAFEPPVAASASSRTVDHGPPVVLPNPHVETGRHPKPGRSPLPILAAAAALLFVVGAGIGAVAKSGRQEPYVRRFTAMTTLLVSYHDQAEKVAAAATKEAQAAASAKLAQQPEPAPQPLAEASVAAPPPIAPVASPPIAPVAPQPTATSAPKSVTAAPTSKPKPAPTSKPKPAPTSKPKASPAPDGTKKKSGDKDWWQKKF
jgi:serine/threonine protein kinase